jgi:hypothetical protein
MFTATTGLLHRFRRQSARREKGVQPLQPLALDLIEPRLEAAHIFAFLLVIELPDQPTSLFPGFPVRLVLREIFILYDRSDVRTWALSLARSPCDPLFDRLDAISQLSELPREVAYWICSMWCLGHSRSSPSKDDGNIV